MVAPDLSRLVPAGRPQEQPAIMTVDGCLQLEVVTYGELESLIAPAAAVIRAAVGDADRIAIIGETSATTAVATLGALRAGLVIVPLNHKLGADERAFILSHSKAEFCLYTTQFERIVPTDLPGQCISLDLLRHGSPQDDPIMPARAMVMYTSGSTGTPKGVPLTHAGYLWAMERFGFLGDVITGKGVVIPAPLFHMNGQFHLLCTLMLGGTALLLPRFDAAGLLDTVEAFAPARLTGVPTMFELIVREIEADGRAPIDTVQSIGMGSAPLDHTLLRRLQTYFPGATISNGYGTTEIGPATFGPHPGGIPTPPLSLGYPMGGVETLLDNGVTEDQGELLIRTGMMTEGYLEQPALTERAFHQGWYRTGDLMRRDKNGFFFHEGRVDDMFVTGGENVHPGAVRRLLLQHPQIEEAAIVPISDPVKGAIPVAFVVGNVTGDEVKTHALTLGPPFAHPRYVEVVESLPLNGANKVDQQELIRRAQRLFGGKRQ